jgi:hypothetical protein
MPATPSQIDISRRASQASATAIGLGPRRRAGRRAAGLRAAGFLAAGLRGAGLRFWAGLRAAGRFALADGRDDRWRVGEEVAMFEP